MAGGRSWAEGHDAPLGGRARGRLDHIARICLIALALLALGCGPNRVGSPTPTPPIAGTSPVTLYLQQAEQSLDRLDRAVQQWDSALEGRGRADAPAPAGRDRPAMEAELREARAALAEMARIEPPPGLEEAHRSWLKLIAGYGRALDGLERYTLHGGAVRDLEQFTLDWEESDQIEDEWRAAVQAAAK
jgi:hypothetical protein